MCCCHPPESCTPLSPVEVSNLYRGCSQINKLFDFLLLFNYLHEFLILFTYSHEFSRQRCAAVIRSKAAPPSHTQRSRTCTQGLLANKKTMSFSSRNYSNIYMSFRDGRPPESCTSLSPVEVSNLYRGCSQINELSDFLQLFNYSHIFVFVLFTYLHEFSRQRCAAVIRSKASSPSRPYRSRTCSQGLLANKKTI